MIEKYTTRGLQCIHGGNSMQSNEVSNMIRKARFERKITQRQLAEK
jgi:hypothetical protein